MSIDQTKLPRFVRAWVIASKYHLRAGTLGVDEERNLRAMGNVSLDDGDILFCLTAKDDRRRGCLSHHDALVFEAIPGWDWNASNELEYAYIRQNCSLYFM